MESKQKKEDVLVTQERTLTVSEINMRVDSWFRSVAVSSSLVKGADEWNELTRLRDDLVRILSM